MLTQEIKTFVNRTKLGFAATTCKDGTPNLSPKGTTIAWDDHHLAFADIYSPGTVENLQYNPAIEVNVVDVFLRKGYRFKGTAEVLSNGELFQRILSHYASAASNKYEIKNIVLVKVNDVKPLFSPAYDHMSEEEIANRWISYWSAIYSEPHA